MNQNRSWFYRRGVLVLLGLSLCSMVNCQEIDPGWIKSDGIATARNQQGDLDGSALDKSRRYRAMATSLMSNFEIVADGEFYELPYSSPEELSALVRKNVLIKFQIHKLYKGKVQDSVYIELPNDMLVFPGEEISRNAKRQRIIDKQIEDLKPILEKALALDQSLEEGDISLQEYREQQDKLWVVVDERVAQDGGIDHLAWIPFSDVNSFYDYGGVIRLGKRFLIGVNGSPESKDAYALEEYSRFSRIYWGERRKVILLALNELTR